MKDKYMLVKNIIRNVARILSITSVVNYFDALYNNQEVEIDEELKQELDDLVMAVNMANNNIASSYIELIDKVNVNNNSEILSYESITNKSIIDIKKIYKNNNVLLDYEILPNGVKVDKGNLYIEYSYFPDPVSFDDEINYYLKLNELLFAECVAGEYLFFKGSIDDAYMWDKRFKSSLFNILRPKKNVKIPARRWL